MINKRDACIRESEDRRRAVVVIMPGVQSVSAIPTPKMVQALEYSPFLDPASTLYTLMRLRTVTLKRIGLETLTAWCVSYVSCSVTLSP